MEALGYEEIKHGDILIAIILRSTFKPEQTCFFSPPDFSQQLGFISYKKNHEIPAHFHKIVHRDIFRTQEVLFLRKGKVEVDFYTNEKEYVSSVILETGDTIFLCRGGHGFRLLEDSDMIEVKQGPYSGKEGDKEVFTGVKP